MRRKFFDLHATNGSGIAAEALRRIGELYAVERQASGLAASERRQLRQDLAQPLLSAWHDWLLAARDVAVSSGTAKAIDYTLKRWPALLRYRLLRLHRARAGPEPPDRARPGRGCWPIS